MEQLLTALRGAGEATRLRIIALLSKGELTVGELVQVLEQSQPRVSRHLKLMGESGLLDRFQEGTQVFYRLARDGVTGALNETIVRLINGSDRTFRQDEDRLAAIRTERAGKAQAYFRENASDWAKLRSLHVSEEQVEAALLEEQGGRPVGRMLDVGTGTGRMIELFAPVSKEALGVDVSRAMLTIARARLADAGLANCQVRQGDMYELPVEDGTQDLIIFHQVLHFAEEPNRAIHEAATALSPGGTLLIADFAPHEQEFLREEHAHRRLGFADEEIETWGRNAGLEKQSLRHLDGGELRVTIWKFEKKG